MNKAKLKQEIIDAISPHFYKEWVERATPENFEAAAIHVDGTVASFLAWHQRKLEAEVAKAREAVDAAIIETLEWVIDEPIGAFTRQRIEDKLAQLRGDDEAAS